MSYQDVLDAIDQTERRLKRAKKEASKLLRFCERHGCYDEDKAEDAWANRQAAYTALHLLYARLPVLAEQ